MIDDRVDTLAGLEAVIGKTPAAVNLKVIDHLDPHAQRWIAASPLLFASLGDGRDLTSTMGGGNAGFVTAMDHEIRLPLALLDDQMAIQPDMAFGSLFLVPAIGETLRVNGRVINVEGGVAVIAVEECYGHCAKALIRSDFWAADAIEPLFRDVSDLLSQVRFMALASMNAAGQADLSPKGDPAGAMVRVIDDHIVFADRPGNRRIDSFRNIIERQKVAMTLVVPGCPVVASVEGSASLSADVSLRELFAVNGKVPALVGRVDMRHAEMRRSGALQRAALWPAGPTAPDIDAAGMFAAHVKANRGKSLEAKLISAAVSIPGALRKGLEHDYKKNLY